MVFYIDFLLQKCYNKIKYIVIAVDEKHLYPHMQSDDSAIAKACVFIQIFVKEETK